jgi:hypothetical protein
VGRHSLRPRTGDAARHVGRVGGVAQHGEPGRAAVHQPFRGGCGPGSERADRVEKSRVFGQQRAGTPGTITTEGVTRGPGWAALAADDRRPTTPCRRLDGSRRPRARGRSGLSRARTRRSPRGPRSAAPRPHALRMQSCPRSHRLPRLSSRRGAGGSAAPLRRCGCTRCRRRTPRRHRQARGRSPPRVVDHIVALGTHRPRHRDSPGVDRDYQRGVRRPRPRHEVDHPPTLFCLVDRGTGSRLDAADVDDLSACATTCSTRSNALSSAQVAPLS